MTNNDVFARFIDKMAGELVFVIGILCIIAYVAIKAIPMFKELQIQKYNLRHDEEMRRLDIEDRRESRKTEEWQREDERDRARTEVIASQNDILSNIVRSNEAMTLQMATLNTSLDDSKYRSRALSETVNDTNHMVSEIHTAIVTKDHYSKK